MVADPKDFWFDFSNESTFTEIECGDDLSLANKVLEAYNIPCSTPSIGGGLMNLDIKHQSAMNVIKISLMEEAKDGSSIYEPMVDENGEVEFVKIGESNTSLTDIYYTIQTKNYKEECKGVMVTGGPPFPIRRELDWKPIWGTGDNSSRRIYDTEAMRSNCLTDRLDQHAAVVYNDPQFDTNFEDGIDNLYELTVDNPYDRIIGYAYYVYGGPNVNDDTSITHQKPSEVPIKVSPLLEDIYPDPGELERTTITTNPNSECWSASAATGQGVEIPIPDDIKFTSVRGVTYNKFLGVSQVYLVGTLLTECYGTPKSNELTGENKEENTDLWIGANDLGRSVFKCTEGYHYVIKYAEADVDPQRMENPRIVFANQSRINDFAKYGKEVEYNVSPGNNMYEEQERSGTATIIPTGGTQGIRVEQIWVTIQLDTPSFVIYDPIGRNADTIAQDLEVLLTPLVIIEERAPVAYNGREIDQVQGIKDHDPTTTQDFEETDMEAAMDDMEGGGVTLTFSFFNKEEVIKISEAVYDYMNSGVGLETTYVCGPNCEPKLGTSGPAYGIINNITYSYNDSGSYTISVNEGPVLAGNFAEFGGNIYTKQVEEVGAQATIIQDLGNHIHYKVSIDGYGVRTAFNCCAEVLRVGDKVNVAVHNNPVEQ